MRPFALVLTAAVAAAGVALVVWAPWTASPQAAAAAATSPGPSRAAPALRVSTVELMPQRLAETITATGTLRADEAVELQPEINGKVVLAAFGEGTRVLRGDLLVKLNDSDLRAQLTRATYRRELAVLKERRLAQLLESGSVRQDEYDAAVSDLNVQRAEVALVEAMIAKTEIRAPFDGVVGLRFVSEGTFVTPTTKIATLQKLDRVKVDFAVPERYATRVRAGGKARFSVAGIDRRFEGEIYAIDPRVDPATRTLLLRAISENTDGRLVPGTFAGVEFTLTEVEGAILVPSVAIIPGVSERYVFVAEGGKAVRRTIEVGNRTETAVHVLSGVRAGERVITSGIQQLRNGLAISVSPDPGATARNLANASAASTAAAAP